MKLLPVLLGAATALATVTAAHAASIDLSPVINETITGLVVPAVAATVPTVAAILVMPIRRYFGQKAGDLMAQRVDDLLNKAIAFGADQARRVVSAQDIHAEIGSNFIVNVAADYALKQAPGLVRQAGGVLAEKITARLASHEDVIALKADAAQAVAATPVQLLPAAA